MEFNFFKKIFNKEEEIQQTIEKVEEEIQPIKEEVKEKFVEEKNKNLTQILSEELKKTERMNVRFSKHTLNLLNEKIRKITNKNDLKNSEIINFAIAYFLDSEINKEPLKIQSRNTKKYKLSFEFSEEEIEYLFNSCIEKNIDIKQSCFQLTQNGIGKDARNKIYQLLMSEIHGLSQNQKEKKFLENLKELKEVGLRIRNLQNYIYFKILNSNELKEKFEETLQEITEMNDQIKFITEFLKRI